MGKVDGDEIGNGLEENIHLPGFTRPLDLKIGRHERPKYDED
jgi:hypothetical protein